MSSRFIIGAFPLNDFTEPKEKTFGLVPGTDGFAIRVGTVSHKDRELRVEGRLQTYVAAGSQYATWRQFPGSIRYEVKASDGEIKESLDLTKSISEDPSTYELYASEPCDQIVGQSFSVNAFDLCERLISEPGEYELCAIYQDRRSNWVAFDVED